MLNPKIWTVTNIIIAHKLLVNLIQLFWQAQILSLMKAYTSIVESSSKIMKDVGGSSIEDNSVNTAKSIKEQLENKSQAIVVGFDPSNIPKIGV